MLKSVYRLCMTGTPMMNNVTELYALIRFCRIKPFDNWESEFSRHPRTN
jgi:SNF2 family DNA or RNA helicase